MFFSCYIYKLSSTTSLVSCWIPQSYLLNGNYSGEVWQGSQEMKRIVPPPPPPPPPPHTHTHTQIHVGLYTQFFWGPGREDTCNCLVSMWFAQVFVYSMVQHIHVHVHVLMYIVCTMHAMCTVVAFTYIMASDLGVSVISHSFEHVHKYTCWSYM